MDNKGLTHFDGEGNAIMVDVSGKNATSRTATAKGSIHVNREVMDAVVNHTAKKGDVLGVARVAGIMAVKQTSSLIPMCHTLLISKCSVDFETDRENLTITAIDKSMVLSEIHLVEKKGGKSGDFYFGSDKKK